MADKPTYEELEQRVRELEMAQNEREKVEMALRESEETARSLLNAPDNVMALVDVHGIILDANEAMAQRFRMKRGDLIGRYGWDLLPPDLAKTRKSYFAQVIESGESLRFEDESLGTWYHNIFFPLSDSHGKVTKVGLLAWDITERRQVEEALRKAREELEQRIRGRTRELSKVNEELRTKKENLEEVNTALKVLLQKRDEDKTNIEEKLLGNVKQLVVPYLEKLKTASLNERQMGYISVLESNLENIISPFSNKLSSKLRGLSPSEIRIANLIKQGRSTKEIATLMNVSVRTIDTHRRNIRTKLGLRGKKANLRTHLSQPQ